MDRIVKIKNSQIKKVQEIGRGSFAKVYLGIHEASSTAKNHVAIKIPLPTRMNRNDAYHEILTMSKLNHDNIVQLIGIIENRNSAVPWMILEYLNCGTLFDFIKKQPDLCSKELLANMSLDVALAMEYLHFEHNLIHGDLHSRNCFVTKANNPGNIFKVKLGDFGFAGNKSTTFCSGEILSRSRSWTEYSNNNESGCDDGIRWTPPEYVYTNLYETVDDVDSGRGAHQPGDVWSYGIVLFEIWSSGETPFGKLTNKSVFRALTEGKDPLYFTVTDFPTPVLTLMMDCWRFKADDRPNFNEIKNVLCDNFSCLS